MSIVAPDGAGPTDTWDLRITGPGLPDSAPLLTVYPSGFPRIALWSYAVLPDRGAYRVDATARGGSGALAVVFVIGEPEILEAPTGVTAAGAAQGGADVTWNAVPGALAYFASLYTHPTQQDPISHFVSGQWSSGTAAAFPPGSISPGVAYDAYVTASSADVASGSTVPTRISASENAYAPVAFVGM
ncbi:hypothetical protein [Anaeromyxobacter oryzisoli]|uniref:hypothetical protein n=1 Tax=Anaeromyxobacter oryzisoli TaxID=2925408 RepID=UPI001F563891|nr:hypothetical protein [Anaeromyxobacter sp. SG63]